MMLGPNDHFEFYEPSDFGRKVAWVWQVTLQTQPVCVC